MITPCPTPGCAFRVERDGLCNLHYHDFVHHNGHSTNCRCPRDVVWPTSLLDKLAAARADRDGANRSR